MNIPNSVKIGGVVYVVKRFSKFPEGDECDGHIVWREQEIRLLENKDIRREYVERVFLHELLHGIINQAQLKMPKDNDEEECLVEGLALGLYQLIVDNPELFA